MGMGMGCKPSHFVHCWLVTDDGDKNYMNDAAWARLGEIEEQKRNLPPGHDSVGTAMPDFQS